MIATRGPIAQLAEPPAHNRSGLGSRPSGPTILTPSPLWGEGAVRAETLVSSGEARAELKRAETLVSSGEARAELKRAEPLVSSGEVRAELNEGQPSSTRPA